MCGVALHLFRDVGRDYPNIDGVLAITHKSGCGTKLFGEDHMALQRVLAGYAKHPNVAAYILIGLGCEVMQIPGLVEDFGSLCRERGWRMVVLHSSEEWLDLYRRAAILADRLFRGERPADIPIEQPSKYELFVNLKTAKALGLTIPQVVLMRAEKVIK